MGSARTELLFKVGRFPPPWEEGYSRTFFGSRRRRGFFLSRMPYIFFSTPYFFINLCSAPFFWVVLSPKAERPSCLAPLSHLNRSRVALAKIKPGRPSAGSDIVITRGGVEWALMSLCLKPAPPSIQNRFVYIFFKTYFLLLKKFPFLCLSILEAVGPAKSSRSVSQVVWGSCPTSVVMQSVSDRIVRISCWGLPGSSPNPSLYYFSPWMLAQNVPKGFQEFYHMY